MFRSKGKELYSTRREAGFQRTRGGGGREARVGGGGCGAWGGEKGL